MVHVATAKSSSLREVEDVMYTAADLVPDLKRGL